MTEPHMMARNSDPETSHAAARTLDTNQMEALVLNAIAQFPNGCIADDVREMFPDIRRHSLIPRIAPLLRCGAIIDTGETRKAKSGRGQRVVKFVPESERVLEPLKMMKKKWPAPERKPLTEEEIYEVLGYEAMAQSLFVPQYAIEFVRAIEKAHGIGVEEKSS